MATPLLIFTPLARYFFSLGLASATLPALAQSVTFAAAATYGSGGTGTSSVAVRDLNGDGRPDIVLANATSSTVGVLLNAGTGTFPASATTYASGATTGNASIVALGDVNADGKPDIAVLNSNDSTVGILLGTGTGTFQAVTTYTVANPNNQPSGLVLADVNNDGRADIITANNYSDTVSVLLSLSGGGFAAPVRTGSLNGAMSVAVANMDADNNPDIVLGTQGAVAVYQGLGTGYFYPPAVSSYSGGFLRLVRVGDVNNDGKQDAVTVNTGTNLISVLLGDGMRGIGPLATYSAGANSQPSSVALGDLNKDGRLDLVTANYAINSAGVLLGQGGGVFPATATLFSTGSNSAPNDVAVADMNGDTKPDIITANFTTGRTSVLLNTSVLAASPALAAANVEVYPNPAHGSLIVAVPAVASASAVQTELRTILGQVVRQQTTLQSATGTTVLLSTAGLATGVYLLHVQAGDDKLVRKVVLE